MDQLRPAHPRHEETVAKLHDVLQRAALHELHRRRGQLSELTPRQREVFVAIALNDVSIDVLALQLGSNRNALYKNLFDARRKLRAGLAAAGHPLSEEDA